MVPLVVVLVVVVVEVRPPGVIVRKDRQQEQHDHRVPDATLQQQLGQILGTLVQRYHTHHDQQPHLHCVLGSVEVHVLVGRNARLISSFEHRVPARAGTEPFVHVAGVVLPEVPQHGDVGWRDQRRAEASAGPGQPPQDVHHHHGDSWG
uniref:(northern house mosquito) hypothetical protein n=1 Tax=Culex pipiens TaxID=7175 RepID=A0A8D8CK27_CULPI